MSRVKSKSPKEPVRLLREEASRIAGLLMGFLQESCHEIAGAGSLRREQEMVKDIDLVALPNGLALGALFSEPSFSDRVDALVQEGVLAWDLEIPARGERRKRLVWVETGTVVELWLACASNFGNILAIRTGSPFFAQKLVTARRQGGFMPDHLRQDDGHLWERAGITGEARGCQVPCRTERDYFETLAIPWIEPRERTMEGTQRLLRRLPLFCGEERRHVPVG
jgi:DNA polymerase/3'-5' exonuclease PolX